MKEKKSDLLQGTLDLLVLKALSLGHLHAIAITSALNMTLGEDVCHYCRAYPASGVISCIKTA